MEYLIYLGFFLFGLYLGERIGYKRSADATLESSTRLIKKYMAISFEEGRKKGNNEVLAYLKTKQIDVNTNETTEPEQQTFGFNLTAKG